jgi:hypothetical protein
MAYRLPSFLPRIAVLVLVALGATAGLTFAAGSQVPSAPAVPTVAATPPAPLIVPDVRNQAFVFAKGTLGDAGFAWRVAGSVRGYAANVVASQTPAAGTRIVDTGAPLITLTLKRNSSYPQSGEAADTSPYPGTVVQAADLAGNALGPAAPATQTPAAAAKTAAVKTPKTPKTAAAPAKTAAPVTAATATTAATPTKSGAAAKWPQSRPVAFDAPGARKEPLDEMPLPDRATALATWLGAHRVKTAASAKYWLYQNEWIVAGAEFGWWRGAEALQTLIAVDLRSQKLWGIGAKSAAAAQQALRDMQARAK